MKLPLGKVVGSCTSRHAGTLMMVELPSFPKGEKEGKVAPGLPPRLHLNQTTGCLKESEPIAT